MKNNFKKYNKLEALKKKEAERDSEYYKKEDEKDWKLFLKIITAIVLPIYFLYKGIQSGFIDAKWFGF